jgi:simple sugar transport system ATP-binding protein
VARELSRPLKLLVASQPTRVWTWARSSSCTSRIVKERDNGTPC